MVESVHGSSEMDKVPDIGGAFRHKVQAAHTLPCERTCHAGDPLSAQPFGVTMLFGEVRREVPPSDSNAGQPDLSQ